MSLSWHSALWSILSFISTTCKTEQLNLSPKSQHFPYGAKGSSGGFILLIRNRNKDNLSQVVSFLLVSETKWFGGIGRSGDSCFLGEVDYFTSNDTNSFKTLIWILPKSAIRSKEKGITVSWERKFHYLYNLDLILTYLPIYLTISHCVHTMNILRVSNIVGLKDVLAIL